MQVLAYVGSLAAGAAFAAAGAVVPALAAATIMLMIFGMNLAKG